MARMRIPCFGCRTPLVVDDHDVGFTCPQCELRYMVEQEQGVLTLVSTGESRAAPPAVSAQPADAVVVSETAAPEVVAQAAEPVVVSETAAPEVVAQAAEPVVVAPPAEPSQAVAAPASRAPLVASVLTIGMMIGLCGGIVGGLGLAAVLYTTLIRPG